VNTERKSMSWVVKAILLASLLLNAGLAWLVLNPAPPRFGYQVAPLGALRNVVSRLPDQDAAILLDAVAQRQASLRQAQRVYETEVARAIGLINQEQFDTEATRAAIERARAQRKLAVDELIDAVLVALPQMSPEGRRALTENTRRKATSGN
jgi:hypothetical protein